MSVCRGSSVTGPTKGVNEWKTVLWSTWPGGEAPEECAQGERGSEQCSGNTGLTSHPSPPPSFYSSKHLLSTRCEVSAQKLWKGGLLGHPCHLSLAMGQQSFIFPFRVVKRLILCLKHLRTPPAAWRALGLPLSKGSGPSFC